MTTEELAAIQARADAGIASLSEFHDGYLVTDHLPKDETIEQACGRDIPALLAEIERLQGEVARFSNLSALYAASLKQADAETERLNRLAEEARKRQNTIINYWFPRLGYSCANQLCYLPFKDSRGFDSPVLAEVERLKALQCDDADCNCKYGCNYK